MASKWMRFPKLLHKHVHKLTTKFSRYSSGYGSTIYALATGGSRCAVAIVRVSGPETSTVLKLITQFTELPPPRKAIFAKFYEPTMLAPVLDQGIILWFPGPKSYTGEDVCEFHIHGSSAVITSLLRCIGSFSSCRMAEPGEFSRRAFLNGKMDLTEIDGLGDLIAAETEMQRIQALNQMSGSLGKLYESWRDRIAKCLANSEAYIDFGEDENIEQGILESIEQSVQALITELKCHLQDKRKGERLRNGVQITIVGKPNVGKSSLLNLLCKREAAIVSDIPGTTRDVVETTVNLSGYPVVFADTAGIRRDPGDVIEKEGIRRALAQAMKADLVLLLLDYGNIQLHTSDTRQSLLLNELGGVFGEGGEPDLEKIREKIFIVFNKIDLAPYYKQEIPDELCDSSISSVTCEGMSEFLLKLSTRVASLCADPNSESAYLTQERYRSHLENCVMYLTEYLECSTTDLSLKSHSLKGAMNSIGYITGHFGTEDILDIIFRDFCIGK